MSKHDYTLDTVFWYFMGDVNNGGYPATVISDDGAQGLRLMVQRGNKLEIMAGVRNVTDPLLEERPVLKRNNGCWESKEQFLNRKAEIALQAELSREAAAKERALEHKLRAESAQKAAQQPKKETAGAT